MPRSKQQEEKKKKLLKNLNICFQSASSFYQEKFQERLWCLLSGILLICGLNPKCRMCFVLLWKRKETNEFGDCRDNARPIHFMIT